MNGEDGDVMVQVVANPNGHVTSVEMKWRSGSQWLDMALMGLFRDANLPPLHDANRADHLQFHHALHPDPRAVRATSSRAAGRLARRLRRHADGRAGAER